LAIQKKAETRNLPSSQCGGQGSGQQCARISGSSAVPTEINRQGVNDDHKKHTHRARCEAEAHRICRGCNADANLRSSTYDVHNCWKTNRIKMRRKSSTIEQQNTTRLGFGSNSQQSESQRCMCGCDSTSIIRITIVIGIEVEFRRLVDGLAQAALQLAQSTRGVLMGATMHF
jgi:hypothetical protein